MASRNNQGVTPIKPKNYSSITEPKNSNLGVVNPAFNPLHFNVKVNRHTLETIVEDEPQPNQVKVELKRTRKIKRTQEVLVNSFAGIDNPTFEDLKENRKRKRYNKFEVGVQLPRAKTKEKSVFNALSKTLGNITTKKRKQPTKTHIQMKRNKVDCETNQVGIDNPAFDSQSQSQPAKIC